MRLIDAHMLLEELQKETALSTRGPEYNRGLLEAQRLTINAPTEEGRPRGEWQEIDLDNYKKYKVVCPFCGMEYIDNYDGYVDVINFNFCPNCGASMRKEG